MNWSLATATTPTCITSNCSKKSSLPCSAVPLSSRNIGPQLTTISLLGFFNGIQSYMRKRVDVPELLDDDLGTRDEIESSLADLRRINRWFGGITTSEHLLSRVLAETKQSTLSVLEVGGAAGDTPAELVRRFLTRGK